MKPYEVHLINGQIFAFEADKTLGQLCEDLRHSRWFILPDRISINVRNVLYIKEVK